MTMVFGKKWLSEHRQELSDNTWTSRVMEDFHNYGEVYLTTLRQWYDDFPGSNKQKRHLKTRLESVKDEDHNGAVSELTWWAFMQWAGMDPSPIHTTSASRPDFLAKIPVELFCEVSALNLSDAERSKLEAGEGVALDHGESLRRVLGKLTEEKLAQMTYASEQKKPCVLVIFDYTEWSGYPTQFFRFFADFLGKHQGIQSLPSVLSALVYVVDQLFHGRIGISCERSTVYYNSGAIYSLPENTFPALNQYWSGSVNLPADQADGWICL
jgi:hypothetical protein